METTLCNTCMNAPKRSRLWYRTLLTGSALAACLGAFVSSAAAQDCRYEACIYADDPPVYIYPDQNPVTLYPDQSPNNVGRGRARDYDTDWDGLSDATELYYGTDPYNADTDWDGVPDGADWAPLDPYRW